MRICFVKYDPELLCGKINGFQNLEFGALDIQTQKVYVFLLAEVTFPQNSPKWFASNFVGHVFESRRRRSFEPLCAKRRRHEFKNTRHGAFVASHEVDFTRNVAHGDVVQAILRPVRLQRFETLRIRFDEHAAPSEPKLKQVRV